MTVTPPAAVPTRTLLPSATLANSNPLLVANAGVPVGSAQAGVGALAEPPSFGARIVNALKAAVGELRGIGGGQSQNLAMTATAPASVDPAAMARAAVPLTSLVPGNATSLPGGTVYSYDANGNPALAGLSGLPQSTQAQLGMSPTMGQGTSALMGTASGVAPTASPQLNMTNQTSVPSTVGGLGIPSATPVLGAPIAIAPIVDPAAAGTTAAGQPAMPGDVGAAVGAPGLNQTVANRNTNDSRSEMLGGLFGGLDDMWGQNATGYSSYGPSMNGAVDTGGGVGGFFRRLLG